MSVRAAPLDLATLEALPVEAYAVFVASDERPLFGLAGLLDWKLAGGLSRLIDAGHLVGDASESLLTTTNGMLPGERVFVFGLGAGGNAAERFQKAAQHAAQAIAKAGLRSVAMGLPEFPPGAAKTLRDALEKTPVDVHLLGA